MNMISEKVEKPLAENTTTTEKSGSPPMPYKVSVTNQQVIHSRHFKQLSYVTKSKQDILKPDIDLKNIVLSDKRKALIQVLKDKRPDPNYAVELDKHVKKTP